MNRTLCYAPFGRVPLSLSILLSCSFLLPGSSALAQTQTQPNAAAGEVYRRASPAVVLIENYNDKGEVNAAGSGFLISADGRILTNFHVIHHTKKATVRLANGDAYDDVSVLDVDERKDIVLIKIKAVELPFLPLGKSGAVDVGDAVFTLGNPLGVFQNTLSSGIVSGIRAGDGYKYFQVTAPISHGSSGGPIFNANGEVIGLAVSTVSEGQNLNFAIPIDYAKGMLASNQQQPLSSFYEPEAKPTEQPTTTNAQTTSAADSRVEEMKKEGEAVFFANLIGKWTQADASDLLSKPHGHRFGSGDPMPEIWAYDDPTKLFRQIELMFNPATGRLQNIYLYPYGGTWQDCLKMFGYNAKKESKFKDGSRIFSYRDKHLNVLVDKEERVVSYGVY